MLFENEQLTHLAPEKCERTMFKSTDAAPDRLVFVCERVFHNEVKCRFIIHHRDGDMELLCGSDAHGIAEGDETGHLVHLHHIVENDPTILGVIRIPPGTWVERISEGGRWTLYNLSPEEDDQAPA